MNKPSYKNIASMAGVSQATVSRIVNGTGNVSSEKKQAVLAAAENLGMSLDPVRQVKRSGTIAFVIDKGANQASASFFTNPFYSNVFRGVESEASKLGFSIVFIALDSTEAAEGRLPPVIQGQGTDGMLVVGHMDYTVIESLAASSAVPMVLVDNYVDGYPCVLTDNVGGIRSAVKHMRPSSGDDIMFFSGPVNHYSFNERLNGFKCALGELGLIPGHGMVHATSELGYQSGYDLAGKILPHSFPKGILCANDEIAIGVLRWLNEKGIKVPDTISVVGFDDIDLSAHVFPTLTTVHVYKEHMGAAGVTRLFRMASGYADPPITLISTEFIERDSTMP